MVCLVINADGLPGGRAAEARLVDCLLAEQPRTVSVLLNINRRNTNVVLGEQYRKLYGSGWIEDTLCGLRFRLSAGSFYQVNREGAELLYETAARMAEVRGGESLWDLYCGAGTIGLSMLSPGRNARPAQVTGVEIVPEAVACAEQNARLNAEAGRIPPDAAHFFCADAGDAAALFAAADTGAAPAPDIVIIDPPRKGTTPELIRELARRGVPRVVYVSCDPETLARDCALFRASGYAVGEVQPVDMFPRTGHVETVCLLSKLQSKEHIEIEVAMDEMDLTSAESKATYEEIREYVFEHTGLKVSHLYIAQVKQKYGIIERENYNKPKSENAKQPQCPPEKEKAITEALKHFGMI